MELSHSGYHYTITLQNEFRMSECINFRNTYEKVPTNAALTLDFQSVKAVDSSCIVMLMSLVQHFNNSEKVQIVNCSSDITDLFSNTTICNWLH